MPKAELHCHIEGAAPPDLVLEQARTYGVDLSGVIRGGAYVWHDFTSFLAAYDAAASVFRTPQDYARLAERHLADLSGQGALYAEIFVSPDHALRAGLSPRDYLAGLDEGMARAQASTGIVARMIVVGVRHFGPHAVEAAARIAADAAPDGRVAGFGLAGDERAFAPADFARAFDIARAEGLGLTAHAGELCGPEAISATLDHLKPARLGHGVRAIEDSDLLRRIAAEGVTLEVCPGSNLALAIVPDAGAHPLRRLKEAGCRVTVNSDDPPFFATSLSDEYAFARAQGFDDAALLDLTRTALDASFLDPETRRLLQGRLVKAQEAIGGPSEE